jgi:hypothetical protein
VPPNTALKADRAYAALVNGANFHVYCGVMRMLLEKERRGGLA